MKSVKRDVFDRKAFDLVKVSNGNWSDKKTGKIPNSFVAKDVKGEHIDNDKLDWPIFYDSYIKDSSFINTEFKRVMIHHCNIEDSDFNNSFHLTTVMNNNIFKNSLFKTITAPKCSFTYGTFINIDFSNSDLTGVTFYKSSFRDVQFIHCNMPKSCFSGTTMVNVDFTDSYLVSAMFAESTLVNVKFIRADMTDTVFKIKSDFVYLDAVLTSVDFTDANLKGSSVLDTIHLSCIGLPSDSFDDNEIELTGNSIQVEEYHE